MNDNRTYTVKATFPPANPWTIRGLTRQEAEDKAIWFVKEWACNGLCEAKAGVFGKLGTMEREFSIKDL